jgi:enamine deaminase RidA (YjgF/YER057c/UK114 family)
LFEGISTHRRAVFRSGAIRRGRSAAPETGKISMTGPIIRLNPPELWDATKNHHSQGTLVEAGRLAFFSGQIAAQKGVDRAPESLREQTEIVCRNLRACLDGIGATPADIVSLRAYIVDWSPEKAAEVFPPLIAFLGETMPTMTGVGVSALFSPDLEIEIEMVARAPDQD